VGLCRFLMLLIIKLLRIDIVFVDDHAKPPTGGHAKTITVHVPERFWPRVFWGKTLGVAEAFMDGDWSCDDLYELCKKLLDSSKPGSQPPLTRLDRFKLTKPLGKLSVWLYDMQSISLSKRVAERHYDAGNELYAAMLGTTMQYSCAVWSPDQYPDVYPDRCVDSLDAAQTFKMDLLCRKLKLKKGMKVLDIGCGWGGLAAYMKAHYHVDVVGLTISTRQIEWCRREHPEIQWVLEDYRTFCSARENKNHFDRVVSVGMAEHVGFERNWRIYFRCVSDVLKPRDPASDSPSLFVMQSIGGNRPSTDLVPFFDRYIFPGGVLPSMESIARTSLGIFVMERWDNFGPHYARTLAEWKINLTAYHESIDAPSHVRKMWEFYLTISRALFESRHCQLWQITFSRA